MQQQQYSGIPQENFSKCRHLFIVIRRRVLPLDSLINGHRYTPSCQTVNVTETIELPHICDCSNPWLASSCAAVTPSVTTTRTVKMFSTQGTESCSSSTAGSK